MIYPYSRILGNNNQNLLIHVGTWVSLQMEKANPKGHVLYDCTYITFLIWHYKNGEHISGCQAPGWRWGKGGGHGYKKATGRILGNVLYLNCECSTVSQDTIIGGSWVMVHGTSLFFLTTVCKLTITSK